MNDVRFSGQVAPYYPRTAPLELRLPQSVYDDSSPMGPTSTGPGVSMPVPTMGDIDSDFGAVDSTVPVLPGKPLRAMRSSVSNVRPVPAVPSWVRTDKMLAMSGCNCQPSPMSGFNPAGMAIDAVFAGGAGVALAYFMGGDTKKAFKTGAIIGAAVNFLMSNK